MSPRWAPPACTVLFPLHIICPSAVTDTVRPALTLGPLHPVLLWSRLPTGWELGEWYVWSPEGTESGPQWHVNPGREKKVQAKPSEGGWQGLRGQGAGGRGSSYKSSLYGGSTRASGVCFSLGCVTVALTCPAPSGKQQVPDPGLRACCLPSIPSL